MPSNVELGKHGQQMAENFLVKKGWHIKERNFRAKTGEIDLIGQDGVYIVFVEVKFRRQSRYGFPREAVGYKKQQHIRKTALFYLTRYNLHGNDIRFDVVEVLSEQGVINIYHIENAF